VADVVHGVRVVPDVLLKEPIEIVSVPVTVGELSDGEVRVIPAKVNAPLDRVKSTEVVPIFTDGSRAAAIVPDEIFVAFKVVKFAPDTDPNEPDHVPVVIVPTLVKDELTTFDASVVPVSDEASGLPMAAKAAFKSDAVSV